MEFDPFAPLVVVDELAYAIDDALNSVDETMGMVGLTIRKIIIAGRMLIVKKGELKYGEFFHWIEAHYPRLLRSVAQRWMKLAEFDARKGADLENANSVTQAYRLAGILPELDGGTGDSKGYGSASFITHLVQASNQLNARISNCPVAQWSAQDRSLLKQRLEPLAELYAKL